MKNQVLRKEIMISAFLSSFPNGLTNNAKMILEVMENRLKEAKAEKMFGKVQ